MSRVVIVMGVSGSGKSTVGERLAARIGCTFRDADDFHPRANKEKMADGIPLTDGDRLPWLAALRRLIEHHQEHRTCLILACSALKETYREVLGNGESAVDFVYLQGSYALIAARMKDRQGHYMKPEMLKSQFETLEEPVDALDVRVDQSVEAIVEEIVRGLRLG